jgi:hypothetical protein
MAVEVKVLYFEGFSHQEFNRNHLPAQLQYWVKPGHDGRDWWDSSGRWLWIASRPLAMTVKESLRDTFYSDF